MLRRPGHDNSSSKSRHLLYLQLRKSILENQILCGDDNLIELGGLALQREMGNFQSSVSALFNGKEIFE